MRILVVPCSCQLMMLILISILAMLEEAQDDVTALSMCISLIVNELKGLSI